MRKKRQKAPQPIVNSSPRINRPQAEETISREGRDKRLEIHVRDEGKVVEVWLTNGEKQDGAVCERLKPLYRACKQRGYLTAVYQSGSQDLADATSALLRYDRRRIAQLEVKQEKRSDMVPGI